jgi:hypothetical protein
MTEPILFAAVALALILAIWLVTVLRRRPHQLTRVALRFQLRFFAQDPLELTERLANLYLMQLGHSRRAFNVLHGRLRDRQILAFDYRFEAGSGSDRANLRRTVVAVRLQLTRLGLVALRDKHFDALGRFRDFAPAFLADPVFDRRFHLFSDRPRLVSALLTPRIREIFLHAGPVDWEMTDNHLVFSTDRVLTATQITRLLLRAVRCARLFEKTVPSAPAGTDAPPPPPATPPR